MQSGVAYSRQRDVSPAARGGGTKSGREHGEPPTTPAAVPSATTPKSGAQGMPSQPALQILLERNVSNSIACTIACSENMGTCLLL
jgi:hypothetical protein